MRRLYLEHKHFLYSVHQNQINLDKIQKQKIPLVFSGQNFFNQRLKSKMLQCSFLRYENKDHFMKQFIVHSQVFLAELEQLV